MPGNGPDAWTEHLGLLHTTGQDPTCRGTGQGEPTGQPFGMAWGWGGGGLDFNAVQYTATVDDQVHLGASARLPVVEPWLLTQLSAGFDPFANHCPGERSVSMLSLM
jgi:hypothetical protein